MFLKRHNNGHIYLNVGVPACVLNSIYCARISAAVHTQGWGNREGSGWLGFVNLTHILAI